MNIRLIWNVEQAELQSCKAKIIECNKWKLFVLHFIKNEKVNKDKSLRCLLSGGKMSAVEAPDSPSLSWLRRLTSPLQHQPTRGRDRSDGLHWIIPQQPPLSLLQVLATIFATLGCLLNGAAIGFTGDDDNVDDDMTLQVCWLPSGRRLYREVRPETDTDGDHQLPLLPQLPHHLPGGLRCGRPGGEVSP